VRQARLTIPTHFDEYTMLSPDEEVVTTRPLQAEPPDDASCRGSATTIADDVLDVPRVARLLHVGRNTIYALVAKNQIPHRRLGKTIRFSRTAVMSWLSTSWQVAKEGE
jgi:excisionase family DNA binding protein